MCRKRLTSRAVSPGPSADLQRVSNRYSFPALSWQRDSSQESAAREKFITIRSTPTCPSDQSYVSDSGCRTEPSVYSVSLLGWFLQDRSWLSAFQILPLPAAHGFLAARAAEHDGVCDFGSCTGGGTGSGEGERIPGLRFCLGMLSCTWKRLGTP